MIAYHVVIILVVAVVATITTRTTALSAEENASRQQYQHRILINTEIGTITHPLVTHKTHLERRRRELREKYGAAYDNDIVEQKLPPRPHVSRHSQSSKELLDYMIDASSQGGFIRGGGGGERALQQQMGALYQGYGTHYIDLWMGSPTPQRQTVIVDTGSGVTAFPCEECNGCGDQYHTDTHYRHSSSNSFRPLECDACSRGYCTAVGDSKKCRISMSYAEGSSWTAYEAVDLCYAGGPHHDALSVEGPMTNKEDTTVDHVDPTDASKFAFELMFGCQVSITGLFITQLADGIMGMENKDTSFWKQMYSRGAIPRPEFSLCFSRSDDADRDGTGAGAITFGGVDPRLHQSPMVFAKNVNDSGFYAVHLKAVYLRAGGGISAQTTKADMNRMHKIDLSEAELNRGNVIVDSGTTDTYFSKVLDWPFRQMWKELTGNDYNHSPISITDAEIAALPTIILVLSAYEGSSVGDEPKGNPDDVPGYTGTTGIGNPRDVVLAIPAAHYLEYHPDIGKYVPRFYTDEEGGGSVIGANALIGHDVFFDNSRLRIGFAESNCDYKSLLLSDGPSPNSESSKIEAPINEEPASEITRPELNGGAIDANETNVKVGESEAEGSEMRGNNTAVEVYAEQNVEVPVIPEPANNNNNTKEVLANPKDKIYAEEENNYQFYEDGK